MSEEPVIRARNLKKAYRLYSRSRYRVLDALGLLRDKPGLYTEHMAVDGIDLDIFRGERVGIIGRNGAGKSTLLKLLTGVIKPTAGDLQVTERIHALLELGSGFHPDFTGRENVYGFLSHMGLSPDEIEKHLEEAVEFAEVEEYIDQPVKSFSTGMVSRLMFAASTVIEPKLLVIDEVLSVGDAYFANKSFRRIRELCVDKNATLLLVTHDIMKAVTLCNRFIWINDGVIRMDDSPDIVANHYDLSVREQEEKRLRQATIKRNKKIDTFGSEPNKNAQEIVFGRIRRKDGMPIQQELAVSKIQFYSDEKLVASLLTSDVTDNSLLILDAEIANWSDLRTIDGRVARSLLPYGSIYHQAPFIMTSAELVDALVSNNTNISCHVEYYDSHSEAFDVDLFVKPQSDRRFRATFQARGSQSWALDKSEMELTSKAEPVDGAIRFGSQLLSIRRVRFFDESDMETNAFKVGGKLEVRMDYTIAESVTNLSPVIQLGFQKNGVHVIRMTLSDFKFNALERRKGEIRASFDPLRLGPGEYVVNVVAMGEGGYDQKNATPYFTVNPMLLDHHIRGYHIAVMNTGDLLIDSLSFVHRANWAVDDVNVKSISPHFSKEN